MSELDIIKTPDGSSTIFLKELNETYHTIHGALSESKHVYIDNGLKRQNKSHLNILEVGLGTGLNTWLTLQERSNINYFAIEPYLLSFDILSKYYDDFTAIKVDKEFLMAISKGIEKLKTLKEGFILKIINKRLEDCHIKDFYTQIGEVTKFDLVYFDAFAPSKQSDIWDIKNLEFIYSMMAIGAELVTYCSQGEFKRNLGKIGFKVLTENGPLLKREMTIAQKII